MKIIFDNNAFIHLTERKEYKNLYSSFMERIKSKKIEHIGTFEFCEELYLLHGRNENIYLKTINQYWNTLNSYFLLPWNSLVQKEIEKREALAPNEKKLDDEKKEILKKLVYEQNGNNNLKKEIMDKKSTFESEMNKSLKLLLSNLEEAEPSNIEIRLSFKKWYKNISVLLQGWLENAFNFKKCRLFKTSAH